MEAHRRDREKKQGMCRCNEKMEEWEDGKMEKSGKESPHGCSHESMGGKDKAGRNVGRRICGYRSKILIAVVLGALLLAGLYALFNDTVLPTLTNRVKEMFDYAG